MVGFGVRIVEEWRVCFLLFLSVFSVLLFLVVVLVVMRWFLWWFSLGLRLFWLSGWVLVDLLCLLMLCF